jgi:glycosyltransferase involved in cell wall biosynthesis
MRSKRAEDSVVRIALVLWTGILGGAERFTAGLALHLRQCGVSPTVVFLGPHRPLSRVLEEDGIAYDSAGFERGSSVVVHPRRFARLVESHGQDGTILDSIGYVPVALRAGGYRGRVVSVEHGALLQGDLSVRKRIVRTLGRGSGSWATDIEVAVSDFLLQTILRHRHARQVVRIYNGVDLAAFSPSAGRAGGRRSLAIGWAGRMVAGKGLRELVRAVAILGQRHPVELNLAGDGPQGSAVRQLVDELGLAKQTSFNDWVLDMPSFWAACDIAAFPANNSLESFGLAAAEAMACGKPVIASDAGGFREVVRDGVGGTLVPPGDVKALANALASYAEDPRLLTAQGEEARSVCERRFDLRETARRYRALFES